MKPVVLMAKNTKIFQSIQLGATHQVDLNARTMQSQQSM